MDPTLVYFLVGCIVWAAVLFYVFFLRRAPEIGSGGKAGFVVVSFLLLPVLGIAVWHQHESYARLEEHGFSVHSGLESAIGIAVGSGSNPTWLYSLNRPVEEVLAFYRRPDNHRGWRLKLDAPERLVFKRGAATMRLEVSQDTVAFSLTDEMRGKADGPSDRGK